MPRGYRATAYQRGSQWLYVNDDEPKVVATSSGAKFAYALGDATSLENSRNENATDIVHASRSVVWLMPGS